jgi:hypothetical protein
MNKEKLIELFVETLGQDGMGDLMDHEDGVNSLEINNDVSIVSLDWLDNSEYDNEEIITTALSQTVNGDLTNVYYRENIYKGYININYSIKESH